jgi:polyferredoxin
MKLPKSRLFRKRSIWMRSLVQTFFFALVALIAVNHTLVENGGGITFLSGATLHAVCPFGGVETLYKFITVGTFVQKVRESSFVLMTIVFGLAIFFGPVFCGWVCPLGTAQEWVGKLGRKIFKSKRYNHFVPTQLDKVLRYARYGVLAWVLYITITSGKLLFQDYDPYYALFSFWTGEVAVSAFIILGLTLILSLFVERPWCKYACPYGAVLGLTNLFRVFQIRRVAATCRNDGACDIKCPMNIPVSEKKVIRDHQCITCMECTSEAVCPVKETVILSVGDVK